MLNYLRNLWNALIGKTTKGGGGPGPEKPK
jgi:hypothetical protein